MPPIRVDNANVSMGCCVCGTPLPPPPGECVSCFSARNNLIATFTHIGGCVGVPSITVPLIGVIDPGVGKYYTPNGPIDSTFEGPGSHDSWAGDFFGIATFFGIDPTTVGYTQIHWVFGCTNGTVEGYLKYRCPLNAIGLCSGFFIALEIHFYSSAWSLIGTVLTFVADSAFQSVVCSPTTTVITSPFHFFYNSIGGGFDFPCGDPSTIPTVTVTEPP